MLSRSQKQLVTRFPLGCIATVSSQGRPMVSPKGTFLVVDDKTSGFGHIHSPQTLSNLRSNSACADLTTPPYDDGITEAGMTRSYQTKYKENYP
jgi:hypothetical protein